mgnify:CR=1 FL=1
MGSLRKVNAFLDGFQGAYNLGNRVAMDIGLRRAADVKPETIDETRLQETTPDTEGMVYDSDTGQYLPRYIGPDGQPTENAATQQGDVTGTESVDGVRPTFDATTSKRYRLGERTQDTPFNEDQVQAERYRRQAGVLTKFGMPDKAAQVSTLARTAEDQGITDAIRSAGTKGLQSTKQAMREEEKQLAMTKAMYDEAVRLGRPDLASQYYAQFDQARTGALKRAIDRADRTYRSTGNVSGYIDTYNRYMADGATVSSYAQKDGGWELTVEAGGKQQTVMVPKDRVGDYMMALTDLDRVRSIEQKRAEIAFKARTDSQEAMNKPVTVGKDQTVVIPATGQTFSPRGSNGTVDPKEYNGVLDDINKMFLERNSNYDDKTGKWNYSPDAVKKSSLGQRLFVGNPSLTPAQVVEIVDNGQAGTIEVDVGGRRQRVPAINYNGRTFLLGGNEAGMPQPAASPAPMGQSDPTTTGLGTRDVRGKIRQPAPQGLQRAPSSTPEDFPRVSSAEQQARDKESGMILVQEAGGPDKARALVEKMRQDIRNPALDGTRRQMLRGHVARIELALAELETGG